MKALSSGFWKTDWFLGAVIVGLVMIFSRASDLIPSLERKAYDLGVRATSREPAKNISIIAIDEESLEKIGRWPWSREVLAKMTDQLAAAKAKVIANTILLSEPQIDPGYQYVAKLLELAQKPAAPAEGSDQATPALPTPDPTGPIIALLKEAEAALNTDRKLSESYGKAGNVVQPMLFALGDPRGRPDKPLPAFALKNAIAAPKGAGDAFALQTSAVRLPIDSIGATAAGLGHLNAYPDVDGGIRTEPLVLQYFDQLFPSMSMMIAARSLNLGAADIKVQPGESVSLGKLRIGTDPALQMYTYF
ncbi:MAG: CHASE2 domain-containing protein, partial [Burkholderiales bacterium]